MEAARTAADVHLHQALDVPVGRLIRRRIVAAIPGVYAMLAPMPKPIRLEGPRVTLSPLHKRDMEEFIRLNRRSRSRFVHPPTTPKRFERYLERAKGADIFRLAVRRGDGGAVLGSM